MADEKKDGPATVVVDAEIMQIVMQQALAMAEQSAALVGILSRMIVEQARQSGADTKSPVNVGRDGFLHRADLPPRFGRPEDFTEPPSGAANGRPPEQGSTAAR